MRYHFKTTITSIIILFAMASGAFAATEGLSPKAYVLYSIGGLHITNSMGTSWVVSLLIIVGIRWMAGGRNPKLIPSKGQAIIESMLEGVQNIINPIIGRQVADKAFPLLIGFFFFILIQNLSGLMPGVGTFGHYNESGHLLYYFRPGNADINMTLALAIVSFIAWLYFIFRYIGVKCVVYDLFGNKADKKEVPFWIYYPLCIIFFGVGIIELISILFRLVSLTFRLFGNIFGGENLLTSMYGIFAYILPVPFYFLELLIALIQAFVFTLLVAVYIGLICNHGKEEEHA